ncbi:uncharacterized protein [Asterias amurensis]|uniref:uncharacterized protein n=1 Tax=Asterias amurensis TaxID=7602 RepID=UPI003AB45716
MWPKLLDMSKDECKRLLRRTELEAYAGIVSAFRAQGDLTKDKKNILNELSTTLSISTERHRAEVRRAVNDEKLSTVAERLSGPNNSAEWAIEGRRLIPLMPRLVPQTVFSLTANQAANAAFSHNLTLPLPSETARKEIPIGNENSSVGMKPQHQPPSPSPNVVVLPCGISIPVKGGPDIEVDTPPVKRSRYDSSSGLPSKEPLPSPHGQQTSAPVSLLAPPSPKSSSGHIITTSRSLSLPATKQQHLGFNPSKQHVGMNLSNNKSLIGLSMAPAGKPSLSSSMSSVAKTGMSSAQSPVKYTYTKAASGQSASSNAAQKVILVSSSSTSFTPSILQRSHSVPSSKSPIIKSGTKQSVILTSMSGQSLSRQPDMKPGGAQQPIVTQRGRQQSAASRSNVRQHAQLSQQQMERKTCQISSSRQFPSSPETMPGTIPVISTGRKASGNIGAVPSIKSTVITARTTTSLISSQMASYVSTNMAGKPRVRAVGKQKLMKQMAQHPDVTTQMGPGMNASNKKQQIKSETGVKSFSQSVSVTATSKHQRSMGQPTVTIETTSKASMPSPAMMTSMPVTTIAGNKVVIGTSSAGVISHHMSSMSPVPRPKPGGIISIAGANKPKTVQSFKAATTTNVGQSLTSGTQKMTGKTSVVMMHKAHPQPSPAQLTESAKNSPVHNIMTSSLLQRPRIAMVTGVTSTTTASNLSASSIRFPTLQSTGGNITMTTTVKSPKRMRSPITIRTSGNQPNQRRQVASISPNALQSSKPPGSLDEVPSKEELSGSVKRGLHPNSEWIDYDGAPPDSASSAIKALLEFRSHPDVSRQTIDLTQMASSASSPSITRISYSPSPSPSQSSNPAPSRISQTSPVMPRVSQYELSGAGGVMQMEGASQLLSNMQSKLKRALTSVKSGKSAPSTSFLQTATMEVEKALQEQNKALLAKRIESRSPQPGDRTVSPAGLSDVTIHKKVQQERSGDGGKDMTVEEQGVVTERVNLSSEDVSSFVDQFELFLESEGLEDGAIGGRSGRGKTPSDSQKPSEATGPQQAADSTQVTAGKVLELSSEKREGNRLSKKAVAEVAVPQLGGPSWRSQTTFEPISSSGQKAAASVVMESGSVDISQMKLEDFTSQRLQEEEDDEEKQLLTSPDTSPAKIHDGSYTVATGSGSEERGTSDSLNVRISSRKRKAPAPIDDEPGPTSMSSWARAAFNLLQRVMRFRGANRSKGDLNAASWFTRPVAAAEAPGYNRVIKTPMDFGTVKRKLESGQYDDFSGFHVDMMLVHNNCIQYNPVGHEIRKDCEEVFQFYATEYAKLTERRERPSPKKTKPEDLLCDKGRTPAVRYLPLSK